MKVVRNASVLFVCTTAGNAANYFFQFLMGRYLSIEDYGAMNALLSVVTSITLPTSAVMIVVAKYASTYSARGEKDGMSSLYTGSIKKVSAIAVVITAAFVLLSGVMRAYLKIDDTTSVLILSIGVLGSFILTVNFGMLQGMQRFYWLGAGMGLSGVARLLLAVVFVLIGARLNGALLATVLPYLLMFAVTVVPLRAYISGTKTGFRHEQVLSYSVPVLAASCLFAFLSNADVIMAKHFLPARDAGIYAAVAVLGKTMFYLPSSFALAVFPMVSVSDALNGDSFKILDRALLFTAAMCAAVLVLFVAVPERIIGGLFGGRFVAGSGLLKYYGAAMFCLAVVSIIISFNLARGKTAFIYSLAAGCVMLVVIINIFHADISQVVAAIAGVFTLVAAYNLVVLYRERHVYYRARSCGSALAQSSPDPEL